MSLEVRLVHARLDAAPGDVVDVPIQLTNTTDFPTTCRMVVVGLGAPTGDVRSPLATDRAAVAAGMASGVPGVVMVPPKSTAEVAMPVAVPASLGIGDHSAAIEIRSDRPGARPSLTPFVIAIGSVARVELVAVPTTLRGRRRAKFKLDVVNHEPTPVHLHISATAPDVEIEFADSDLRLEPGQRSLDAAKVRGPRHWSGEPTQHNLVITARGRSGATSTTTAAYVQRPLFAHRARAAVAALTVIALWLGAIGGVALWWSNRQDDQNVSSDEPNVVAVDTDDDGVADEFTLAGGTVITGIDTDGDGVADQFFDADRNPVDDPTQGGGSGDEGSGSDSSGGGSDGSGDSADGGSAPGGPTSAVVRGTVTADGDLSNITITLQPLPPAAAPPADAQAFAGPTRPKASKIWSARMVPLGPSTLNPIRQTEPLAPITANPKADGVWQFPDVPLLQTYTVVFAKPGYQTRSFVITPPSDGSPVDLDVELVPGKGSLRGRVTGPRGALGGAAITVSNGTLTFTTTAATVGDVGTWSVDQVSTPGVYTVTAALRGYGTEVRQVTLSPEQPDGEADLAMRPGVGSISGRIIGPDGQPIGGATVTASDGETTRTTSSLTEGDVGSYSIPQLTRSANYTLTVEAPGYLTQSRRTPVVGAVGGVDFSMSRTTIRLTGSVTSGASGIGVANAGLILRTGDLEFRAATVGGDTRGQFAIDDLPPGEYTVTVEHYQHVTSTQAITLTAGVAPPPLEIALERTTGPPELATGSLVVEVIDPTGEDAATREINNATVRLVRTRTGEEVASLTQEPFNFRLDDISIGTYTVLVTAPRYNPAPPRQVSVGQSETRIEVQMQRLAQASGSVIDSITKAKLTNYFVNIFRQPENPGDTPVATLSSNPAGLWQTPPDSLTPGTYRIEISDSGSPPGYAVRNDQLLDSSVVGVGPDRNMRFVVAEGVVDPINIADIEADAYPAITGRVYRPATSEAITYTEIDRSELSVSMSCGGAALNASVSDDAGVIGATPPLYDSFTITKEQVDAGNLTGTCTLAVDAGPGLAPTTEDLVGVDANDGVTSSDLRLHIVVAPPAPSIGGTVFWKDGPTEKLLGNVAVAATRTVRFGLAIDPAPSATPTAPTTPASATSNASGEWQLNGQVYGVAPYTFSTANFAPGVINVRVDDTGASATAGAGAHVAEDADGKFHVELSAPTPRTLTGEITVESTTPDFDALSITATSPTDGAIDEDAGDPVRIVRGVPAGTVLPFSIVNAQPGTWKVSVNLPDSHYQFDTTVPVKDFVDAGPSATPVPGFDITMRELAELELTLLDGKNAPITTVPRITLTPVGGGTELSGAMKPTAPGANTFRMADIPVAAIDPATEPMKYTMGLSITGYDVRTFTAVPVSFLAGQLVPLPLTVPRFGTINGTVLGDIDSGLDGELDILGGGGTFTVARVDAAGNPLTPLPADYLAPTFGITGGGYTVTGQPGYYRISVTHPQFTADLTPPTDVFDRLVTPPLDLLDPGVANVFRIVNDEANTPESYVLPIIRGTLDVSAVRTLAAPATDPANQVPEATYTLTRSGETTRTGQVGVDGSIDVTDLYPGIWELQLREYDGVGVEAAFPVITDVDIPRAVAGVAGTIIVRAPLPPYSPTVTGEIVGQNLATPPVLVPLPAAATFTVSSTFDVPPFEKNGTTVARGSTLTNATITDTDQLAGRVSYTFTNVPSGAHQVTLAVSPANAMDGYTLDPETPLTQNLVITSPGAITGPKFVFTVPNVTVKVALSDDDYDGINSIKLRSPSLVEYSGTYTDSPDTLTFLDVGPEIGEFELEFKDDLHSDYTAAQPGILVEPDLVAPFEVTGSAAPIGEKGRLFGTSKMQVSNPGAGSITDLAAGGTITITGITGTSCKTPCVITAGPGSMADYSIDVGAGSYQVVTALTGFQQQTLNVDVVAGKKKKVDVLIVKLATISVKVTSPDGSDDGTDPDAAPADTTVELYDNRPTPNFTSGTRSGDVWTFLVEPERQYQARVNTPGIAQQFFPSSSSYITPQIGQVVSQYTAVMAARTVAVNVTVPDGDDEGPDPDPAPAGTTVTARFGVTPPFPTLTGPSVVFSSTTVPAIPFLAVGGTVIAQATGYRTASRQITTSTAPQTINVPLLPLATVTGTINAPVGTDLVKAQSGGDIFFADIVDPPGAGPNRYTFDKMLDANPDGTERVWTISYDVFGQGIDSESVTVSSANTPAATNLTVVPQPISVTFTVTGTPGLAPDESLDIGFNGTSVPVTPSTDGSTSGEISILENDTDRAYTVSGAGYLPHPGGTVVLTNRSPKNVPVVPNPSPLITGTVMTDAPVAEATVRVCADEDVAAICASPVIAGATAQSVATTGRFTISTFLPAGDYEVWATKGPPGAVSGHVHLTVDPDRIYTWTPSSTIDVS